MGYAHPTKNMPDNIHYLKLEGNYGFTKWLEAGAFVYGGGYKTSYSMYDDNEMLLVDTVTNHYFAHGLSSNVHILPLFLNPSFCIVDLYITPKIGLSSNTYGNSPLKPDYFANTTKFYYSIGAGIGVNINKYVGIFVEYSYFRKNGNNVNRWFGGVNVRF